VILENFEGMLGFTKDVIHLGESGKVSLGVAFLIGDEDVSFGGAHPASEDALHKDVGIKVGLVWEDRSER